MDCMNIALICGDNFFKTTNYIGKITYNYYTDIIVIYFVNYKIFNKSSKFN